MSAVLDQVTSAISNERRAQESRFIAQWRELVADVAEDRVSRSAEDIVLEMGQLGKTDADLIAAVAFYREMKGHSQKRIVGIEATESMSAVSQKREQLNGKMAEELNAVRKKYHTQFAELDAEIAALQQKVMHGNDSVAWLMGRFSKEAKELFVPIDREMLELRQQRSRLMHERESANTSGTMTKEKRESIQKREAAIDSRQRELNEQRHQIEKEWIGKV